jgi:hypothetical protein
MFNSRCYEQTIFNRKHKMKKFLGITALGFVLTVAGASASWAQATGGAGGAGGPGNSQMSSPESGSNMSAPSSMDQKKMEMQKDKSPASGGSGISQEK